jgi:hypothetical protein
MRQCTAVIDGIECGLETRLDSLENEPLEPSNYKSTRPREDYAVVTLKIKRTYLCPLGHKTDEISLQQRTRGLTVYRKSRNNGETWHLCSNCSSWPTTDFIDQIEVPSTGEMCNECQAKRRAGNCY